MTLFVSDFEMKRTDFTLGGEWSILFRRKKKKQRKNQILEFREENSNIPRNVWKLVRKKKFKAKKDDNSWFVLMIFDDSSYLKS